MITEQSGKKTLQLLKLNSVLTFCYRVFDIPQKLETRA